MFTWSFGWTGDFEPSSPPASSIARFAITSFTFMLVWVPEPVCQTKSGKWSSSVALDHLVGGASLDRASELRARAARARRFAIAAAFFRIAIARTTSIGIRSASGQPIEKWWRERCVCAPQ